MNRLRSDSTRSRGPAKPGARRAFALIGVVGLVAASQPACDGTFIGHTRAGTRLVVQLVDKNGKPADEKIAGTHLKPLGLKVNTPQPFQIIVQAINEQGQIDANFNSYVRISAKPGAIDRIDSPAADGRNLKLDKGVSPQVTINLSNAYGNTFIIADDLGYVPADPTRTPPPQCADGIDNDHDGKIDFGSSIAVNDDGCAFANDDTETGGTYSEGSTQPIFYALPRIADLRGLTCDATGQNCSGNGKTPYPNEQLLIDTGFHDQPDGSQRYDFDMVVTRISASGFYASDTKDPRGQFTGVFAFNFSAPPGMRICDRLKTFTGTASEFFGFTQLGYPTWTLEAWNPELRPCLIPDAVVLGPGDIPADTNGDGKIDIPTTLLPRTASLMRVLTDPDAKTTVKVTSKFGAGLAPKGANGAWGLDADHSNCDLNGDGSIDFTNDEGLCNNACTVDPDCTEYSNFAQRSTFRLFVSDGNVSGAIQADATTDSEFKPLDRKGQPIKSFTGIMTFFSGGSQYTIEARCPDDIVTDLDKLPIPSDKACVQPRTDLDENPQ
jgi:hypothetical protein